MSDARFWAETIGQTAVDIGGRAVIAAGATAVMATIGAPAAATMIVSTGAYLALDGFTKWATGGESNFSEVVSDFVLNRIEDVGKAGKAVGDWIGKGAKQVTNSWSALLGFS